MRRLFRARRDDAAITWLAVTGVFVAIVWSLSRGAFGWVLFGGILAAVLLAPVVAFGEPRRVPPWPVALLAALPFVVAAVAPWTVVTRVAAYATVAAVALVAVAQIDAFTPVRMNRGFAVALVVLVTATAAGVWELGKWVVDLAFGTELVPSNEVVMWRLVTAVGAGVVAAAVFDRYLRRLLREEFVPDGFDVEDAEEQIDDVGGAVSRALADVGLTRPRQRLIVRGAQVVLVGIGVVGVVTLNLNVVVNASIGLAATLLPGVLERDYSVETDVGLTLWIAAAVTIHALGTVYFYQTVWGWHNIAHTLTGTLVAAIGYTTVRALEEHTSAVAFPPKFTFLVVVLVVFSAGVFWEILEFTFDGIAARVGADDGLVLAQHGLTDTMSDLVANTVGAIIVAGAATYYRLRSVDR